MHLHFDSSDFGGHHHHDIHHHSSHHVGDCNPSDYNGESSRLPIGDYHYRHQHCHHEYTPLYPHHHHHYYQHHPEASDVVDFAFCASHSTTTTRLPPHVRARPPPVARAHYEAQKAQKAAQKAAKKTARRKARAVGPPPCSLRKTWEVVRTRVFRCKKLDWKGKGKAVEEEEEDAEKAKLDEKKGAAQGEYRKRRDGVFMEEI